MADSIFDFLLLLITEFSVPSDFYKSNHANQFPTS